jgi:TRAP-type transport system periplasmic protein
LKALGVKIVAVDKSGFEKASAPLLDKFAQDLGPHAVKLKDLIKAVKSN